MPPALLATWDFSEVGVRLGSELLGGGANSADVVEACVREVEMDGRISTIGYGGLPNESGVLQLDAGFMLGNGSNGAVMAIEGYRSAVGIARQVMEQSRHSLLVGEGARLFAKKMGHESMPNEDLLTDQVLERWQLHQSGIQQQEVSRYADHFGRLPFRNRDQLKDKF